MVQAISYFGDVINGLRGVLEEFGVGCFGSLPKGEIGLHELLVGGFVPRFDGELKNGRLCCFGVVPQLYV